MQFLTDAENLVDNFWTYGLDHGYGLQIGAPRTFALGGVMTRALETGNTAKWAGIERLVGVPMQGCSGCQGTTDIRETGYAELYVALATMLDPNITGNSGNQATYCGYVANTITNFWMPLLSTDSNGNVTSMASWGQNLYSINAGYPNYGLEAEPWQAGITANGFARAYDALSSTGCNSSAAALKALNLAKSTISYIYQYSANGNRTIPAANGGGMGRTGVAYIEGAQASGEGVLNACSGFRLTGYDQMPSPAPCVQGTVSGTAGDNHIHGSGTNFSSGGLCNSLASYGYYFGATFGAPNFIGIVSADQLTGVEVHPITSCDSDTQITLSEPLTTTFSGRYYEITPTDGYDSLCSPSKGSNCWAGNPDFVLETGGAFGWLFDRTHDLRYRIWADDLYGVTYGGPAGGPGSTGSITGPMASGSTSGSYPGGLPSCSSSTPPCGGTPGFQDGKPYGQGSGMAGAADNYFAYRLMLSSSQ